MAAAGKTTKTDSPQGNGNRQQCPGLRTVCVIETANSTLLCAAAFPDTLEGNAQAEARFMACIEENGGRQHPVKAYSPYFNAEETLDQGYWHHGTYAVYITHT